LRTLRADVRRSRTTVAVPGQPDAAQRARTAFTVATQQGPVGCVSDWAVCARPLDFQVSGAVGRPVQLWHGDEDPVIPVHHAEHLLSLLPGAALHVWPGEGHFHDDQRWREIPAPPRCCCGTPAAARVHGLRLGGSDAPLRRPAPSEMSVTMQSSHPVRHPRVLSAASWVAAAVLGSGCGGGATGAGAAAVPRSTTCLARVLALSQVTTAQARKAGIQDVRDDAAHQHDQHRHGSGSARAAHPPTSRTSRHHHWRSMAARDSRRRQGQPRLQDRGPHRCPGRAAGPACSQQLRTAAELEVLP